MLVVFDWDGTLVDSADKIIRAMHMASAKLHMPPLLDDSVRQIIGLGLPEAIKRLYPKALESELEAMQLAYVEAFVAIDRSEDCHLFAGVENCMAALEARGIAMAIATGKSRKGLNRMLDNFDWHDRFAFTRCADETASKPNPLMLEELMLAANIDAQQMIMVGDTSFDLEMARNAGVASVGVSYGAHRVELLEEFSPITILDNLEQLVEIVDAQMMAKA